jgi:ribonuclease P protein component
VGTAVTRNRVRRRLREIVRARLPRVESGWDLALVARGAVVRASYDDLRRAVDEVLSKAGLLRQ